jgi:hypothetical protein
MQLAAEKKKRCAQQGENTQSAHTCHRKLHLFSTTDNEPNLTQISLDHNAIYPQMKSLNGFSDLQLGRYCFNLETEFSHQGFRNPRLKLASFSQKQFSQND